MLHNYALVNEMTKQQAFDNIGVSNRTVYDPLNRNFDGSSNNDYIEPSQDQRFNSLANELMQSYQEKQVMNGLSTVLRPVENIAPNAGGLSTVAAKTVIVEPDEKKIVESDVAKDIVENVAKELKKEGFIRNNPMVEGYSVKHKTSHVVEVIILVLFILGVFVLINIYLTQQRLELMIKLYANNVKNVSKILDD